MDEILVKYILDEATKEERKVVEDWMAEKGENRAYFEELCLIWEESKKIASQSTIDENAAWERFRERIKPADAMVLNKTNGRRMNVLKAAAGIAILLLGSWMVSYLWNSPATITLASGNSVRVDTLPDGSVVTLNAHSSIQFPKNFSGKTRPVQLQGEAFFDVSPDKNKPFRIHAGEVDIQVLGTSFNVRNTREQTEVIVETGIVRVAKKNNSVKLLPNQKAIVTQQARSPMVVKNNDELYNYYRTNTFVCNNTPLYRLVEVLNKAYNTHIIIANDQIKNLPLTSTFREENLQNILSTVVETFHLNMENHGDTIVLK